MGLRRFGVPVGGWFDRESAQVANQLVRRPYDSVCLELTLGRIQFRAEKDVWFAVAGAPCGILLNGTLVGTGGRFLARRSAEICVSIAAAGSRAYLSFPAVKMGLPGTRLRIEDVLETSSLTGIARSVQLAQDPVDSAPVIRVLRAPQANLFDFPRLLGPEFEVSQVSNRVGIRLHGELFPHAIELPSEPAGFGVVQVTPDGGLVILGPDGPTIGGYPKMACVISADFDRLAQLRPGSSLRFAEVDMNTARALALRHERRMRLRLAELALV